MASSIKLSAEIPSDINFQLPEGSENLLGSVSDAPLPAQVDESPIAPETSNFVSPEAQQIEQKNLKDAQDYVVSPEMEQMLSSSSDIPLDANQDYKSPEDIKAEEEARMAQANAPKPPETMGFIPAFETSFSHNILPIVAATATFGKGFAAGFSKTPINNPIAKVGGGLLGGFVASGIASGVAKELQDYVGEFFSPGYRKQEEIARKAQPVASIAGEGAAQLLTMRPSITTMKGAMQGTFYAAKYLTTGGKEGAEFFQTVAGKSALKSIGEVVFGAGSQATVELINQAINGKFDLARLASAVLIGSLIHKENRVGRFISGAKPSAKPGTFPSTEEITRVAEDNSAEDLADLFTNSPEFHDAYNEAVNTGGDQAGERVLKIAANAQDPNQTEMTFPKYEENGGFRLIGQEGATPAPAKTPVFDESGQSQFDFFGELAQTEPKPVDGVPVDAEAPPSAPAGENPNQGQLDFNPPPTVASIEGQKVKATFQGETGFLEVQDGMLVLRKPRSKTVFEVGPAGENNSKALTEFEGLEIVQSKNRGQEAPPAENSANAIVKQDGYIEGTESDRSSTLGADGNEGITLPDGNKASNAYDLLHSDTSSFSDPTATSFLKDLVASSPKVAEALKNIKVEVGNSSFFDGRRISVASSSNVSQTIAHETTHAFLDVAIDEHPEFKSSIRETMNDVFRSIYEGGNKKIENALFSLKTSYNSMGRSFDMPLSQYMSHNISFLRRLEAFKALTPFEERLVYAMTGEHEFLAAVSSDNEFRNLLKGITLQQAEPLSAWDKFLNAIKGLLGLTKKTGKDAVTALDVATKKIGDILQEPSYNPRPYDRNYGRTGDLADIDSSTPRVDPEITKNPEFNKILDNYLNGSEASIVDAARATGVINLNTYDPAVNSAKLVASTALVIEEKLNAAKGATRTLEDRATGAAQWIKDAGLRGVATQLEKEASRVGVRKDSMQEAYKLLLMDALERNKAAVADYKLNPTPEAMAKVEESMYHYTKIKLGLKAQRADVAREFQAMKKNKMWFQAMDLALNSDNPVTALNQINRTLIQKTLGAACEVSVNACLSPLSAVKAGVSMSLVSSMLPAEYAVGAARAGNWEMARQSLKQYLYYSLYFNNGIRNAWTALKTLEPVITNTTSIDELRRGAMKNPNQYGGALSGINEFRSRGEITSENFNIDPSKGTLSSIGAIVVDAIGELYRAPQRFLVPMDEFFKTVTIMSQAHARFAYEGITTHGIKDEEALARYVQKNMDQLIDENGNLYNKENIMNTVTAEVRREGLTGIEAARAIYERTQSRLNDNMGAVAKALKQYGDNIAFTGPMERRADGTKTFLGKTIDLISDDTVPATVFRLATRTFFLKSPAKDFLFTAQRLFPEALSKVPILKEFQVQYLADMASGDPWRVAAAKGRSSLGALYTAVAGGLAYGGYLYGFGPNNNDTQKLEKKAGRTPYSFRIPKQTEAGKFLTEMAYGYDSQDEGNYYIGFKNFAPHSNWLSLFADVTDTLKNANLHNHPSKEAFVEALGTGTLLAVMHLVTEKSSLTQFKQMMAMMDAKTIENGSSFKNTFWPYLAKATATSVVPSTLSTVLRAEDPVLLEARTLTQAIMSRLGVAAPVAGKVFNQPEYVPKQWTILGENIDRTLTGMRLVDVLNPILVSNEKNDPVYKELISLTHNWTQAARLHSPSGDAQIWDMRDFYNAKGQDAYDRLQELIGTIKLGPKNKEMNVKEALAYTFKSKAYQALPAQEDVQDGIESLRAKVVMNVLSNYRKAAMAQVLSESFVRPADKTAFSEVVNKNLYMKKRAPIQTRDQVNSEYNASKFKTQVDKRGELDRKNIKETPAQRILKY